MLSPAASTRGVPGLDSRRKPSDSRVVKSIRRGVGVPFVSTKAAPTADEVCWTKTPSTPFWVRSAVGWAQTWLSDSRKELPSEGSAESSITTFSFGLVAAGTLKFTCSDALA